MEECRVLKCLNEKLGQVYSGLIYENLRDVFLTSSSSYQEHLDGSK